MQYVRKYKTPVGMMTLAADADGLVGAWFDAQKCFGNTLTADAVEGESPFLDDAVMWLDEYFSGVCPHHLPTVHFIGSPFRIAVWRCLLQIPFGMVVSYKQIAGWVAADLNVGSMSAQAVGGAVGHNPVSIIVPCHRVVGADGSLTGYAGGVDKKKFLLDLEGVVLENKTVSLRGYIQ